MKTQSVTIEDGNVKMLIADNINAAHAKEWVSFSVSVSCGREDTLSECHLKALDRLRDILSAEIQARRHV